MQPTQLTHNDWEWDQHSSFSPDGSNQRQLTNLPFEAWKPTRVKYLDLPDQE